MTWTKTMGSVGCFRASVVFAIVACGWLYAQIATNQEKTLVGGVGDVLTDLQGRTGVVTCTQGRPCVFTATIALPSAIERDDGPVLYARAIGPTSTRTILTQAHSVDIKSSHGGPLKSTIEISFTPYESGPHRVYVDLVYGSRNTALVDPPPRDKPQSPGSNFVGKPLVGSPFSVIVSPAETKQEPEKCTRGDIGGYWVLPSVSQQADGFLASTQCPAADMAGPEHVQEWVGKDCTYPPITAQSVATCLQRWNVVLIGDSVTRQMRTSLLRKFPNPGPAPAQNTGFALLHTLAPYPEIEEFKHSNPFKIEAPKMFNQILFDGFLSLMNQTRMNPSTDVAVVNFGLHDAAYGSLKDYPQTLEKALWAILKAGYGRVIWRSTTAVHPWVFPESQSARYRYFTSARVQELNTLATQLVTKINEDLARGPIEGVSANQIELLDAYEMTVARPDGLRPEDMRHYCEGLMLGMWKVLMAMLC